MSITYMNKGPVNNENLINECNKIRNMGFKINGIIPVNESESTIRYIFKIGGI